MLNIVISFLTFILILVSLFLVLVVLMQRANSNAGMGSAFGGGAAESAFGAETTNVLTRFTKWSAFVFFGLSLILYLLYMVKTKPVEVDEGGALPVISAPAAPETTTAEDAVVAEEETAAPETTTEEEAVPAAETE